MASREEVNAMIVEKISSDPGLRAAFLADPKGTLEAQTGLMIPEGVTITVHEESPANIQFVIPASSEVSDADLALVAGGAPWTQNYSNGVNLDPY